MKMKMVPANIFAMIFFGVLGCEKVADISLPEKYEQGQMKFSYPRNWKVTEDEDLGGVHNVFVESPGDAIFIAQVYAKELASPLMAFAETFSMESRKATPVGNIDKGSFTVVDMPAGSAQTSVKETFSISLLGEKVPHIRVFYAMEAGDKVAFMIAQSATEDLGKVEPGFNLIVNSFVVK